MQSNNRQSLRLKSYDYSQQGIYFITICIRDRQCLLGEIFDGSMRLNEMGDMVEKCWNHIPNHFPHMTLDAYVIMPNHIHGIIMINQSIKKGECYSQGRMLFARANVIRPYSELLVHQKLLVRPFVVLK